MVAAAAAAVGADEFEPTAAGAAAAAATVADVEPAAAMVADVGSAAETAVGAPSQHFALHLGGTAGAVAGGVGVGTPHSFVAVAGMAAGAAAAPRVAAAASGVVDARWDCCTFFVGYQTIKDDE